ncbi:hypothetical protein SMB93_003573 [Cronobacter sakazakii]|nr:hypothetical protein [Cronobacter sakazakii]
MKPMLKTAFFTLVNDLLARGITPELKVSPMTSYGSLKWSEGDSSRVEELYSVRDCSPLTASTFRKRFTAWFAEIMQKHQEQLVADAGIVVGCKVWDDLMYALHTVTEIRAGGVLVLDNGVERTLEEVKTLAPNEAPEVKEEKLSMKEENGLCREITATDAILHMANTLTRHIEQSEQPGFDAGAAYRDIQANYDYVAERCKDRAITTWLFNHLCFEHFEDIDNTYTFADVNKPYRDQFNHILASGWRPATSVTLTLSNLFEMDWWGADNITVTKHEGHEVYGTASVTDTEGLYQIAFEWLMDMGENADRAGMPAVVSITSAKFTLPNEVFLQRDNGTPLDALEAIQELDFVQGFCAGIILEIYDLYAPAEGEHLQG